MSGLHGGKRVGAGRKPKNRILRGLEGGRFRGAVAPISVPSLAMVEVFDAPDDLSADERAIWQALAPHAFANRTLTKATAYAFSLLCQAVVAERRLSASGAEAGGADHRGMLREVHTRLLQFNLAPCGKPLFESAPETVPVNPLSRYRKA